MVLHSEILGGHADCRGRSRLTVMVVVSGGGLTPTLGAGGRLTPTSGAWGGGGGGSWWVRLKCLGPPTKIIGNLCVCRKIIKKVSSEMLVSTAL